MFASGAIASDRQTSAIEQRGRSLVGVGKVLKGAMCSFCDIFQPPTRIYDLCSVLNRSSV